MAKKTEAKVTSPAPESTDTIQTPAPAPVEPVVVPPVEPETDQMVISKEDFNKLIGTITEQNKKIDILFDAADKSRLARAQAGSNGEQLIRTVKVHKWPDNNKFIIAWKLTHNLSEIVANRWHEKQDTFLVFEDGSQLEVPLLDFYRKVEKVKAEIIGRTHKDNGKGVTVQYLNLRFGDGKVLDIDATYIN